ncbi:MAG: hypothetical protein H7329_09360 [Opitutaceae bacterium]|nr:hypothetical protein [Cytophagales bacterium]
MVNSIKSFFHNKIIIGSVLALTAGASVFYAYKKYGKAEKPVQIDPGFSAYISAFTTGLISSEGTIRIVLAQNAKDSVKLNQEGAEELFDFEPSVKGKAYWLDQRTVEFRPAERLKTGEVYAVSFELDKVANVKEENLKKFKFSIKVVPQFFEIEYDGIKSATDTDLKKCLYLGRIITADIAVNAEVEKILSANHKGLPLSIKWEHASDKRTHSFIIQNIVRSKADSKLILSWNGDPIGVDISGEKELIVPAEGVFKFLEAIVIQEPDQYVSVKFSDPLLKSQDLAGLIKIGDLSSLKFTISGNEAKVYPSVRQTGTMNLSVNSGIQNVANTKLDKDTSVSIVFELLKPAIRLIGNGVIVPSTDGIIFPFEAVAINAVDVKIIKIFENNIAQFLQSNNYDGSQELVRVGRPVLKKTIQLSTAGVAELNKWNRYTLDLADLIKTEPGAIYQVVLSFKKKYVTYPCEGKDSDETASLSGIEPAEDDKEDAAYENGEYISEYSNWDYYEESYNEEEYDYNKRDNPCNKAYYQGNKTSVKRNVLASDLGLIAKRGSSGEIVVAVTDLKSTEAISGAVVELYDFQQQIISTGKTDGDGLFKASPVRKPFLLIVKQDKQRGYLKLDDGSSLSLSNFDVSGAEIQKGLKGFIYGERGVWRPGDSLFLTFMLEDKNKLMPKAHPVIFELSNPQGQVTSRIVRTSSVNGLYAFTTATMEDDPTGDWLAKVKVGGAIFTKGIKIESIKPNRLKINLDFGKKLLTVLDKDVKGNLNVRWLHGAKAGGLKAKFDVVLSPGKTVFPAYKDYSFDDPGVTFASVEQTIFEGYLDAEGNASVNAEIEIENHAPGALNAIFKGKVFEQGGDFSIDNFTIPYYPFEYFVGIMPPKGDKARGMLLTDEDQPVQIVTVDADGKPVSRNGIQMEIFKLDWRWWWEQSANSVSSYVSDEYLRSIKKGTASTASNGRGEWKFNIKYPEWGRFYIRATDPVSGHTTGKIVFIDWPGWAGKGDRGMPGGASMLTFFTDKEKYNVGEKVKLSFPSNEFGKALISIENGSKILKTFWVKGQKEKTEFEFEVSADMAPNVYAHITMVQPHSQKNNDLPIRMYGVAAVMVEDPQTKLEPVINMPEVLKPEQNVTIKVSEKSGKPMAYTLAVVDEGLLDLTRFKTPDPWKQFYAREALGVKTWDLYDFVFGAYGGELERLLSIGGDGEVKPGEDKGNSLRFKPVVKFFGPFYTDGKEQSHTFRMPNYIGSVRTMIVAGNEGAYGSAEKATPVRQSLMAMATLPRVIGPDEEVKLPVNIFAMDNSVKQVTVSIATNDMLFPVGGNSVVLNFAKTGDQLTTFNLKVKPKPGVGKVVVTAVSGSNKSTYEIEIKVRVPNPSVSNVIEQIIDPGQTWTGQYVPAGMVGTNKGTIEVSVIPPINLESRLRYLINYPHGCIEQTTSSVFPQLFISQLTELDQETKARIDVNVKSGIEALSRFQTSDGGFSYWPGQPEADDWGTTYAGHFLLEAKEKGYEIPEGLLSSWLKYQSGKTSIGGQSVYDQRQDFMLAYRLYTLALAGKAEIAAMNRLKEMPSLTSAAAWRLAAAYALSGQKDVARDIIANLPVNVEPYREMAFTYGSDDRDEAMILETLVLLGDRAKGAPLVKEISANLSNQGKWLSTQSTAYSLIAVSKFSGLQGENKGVNADVVINGKQISAKTGLPVAQLKIALSNVANKVSIRNNNKTVLYLRVISEGVPAAGDPSSVENNLNMNIVYKTGKGKILDPSNISQGTDFVAEVSITNPGTYGDYKQMALNQIFPSGWEITNTRLDGTSSHFTTSTSNYLDIRDDRVYTYFDLKKGETKTFKVLLTAAYIGKFYLPTVSCEAMYDNNVSARKPGKWVNVVKVNMIAN